MNHSNNSNNVNNSNDSNHSNNSTIRIILADGIGTPYPPTPTRAPDNQLRRTSNASLTNFYQKQTEY